MRSDTELCQKNGLELAVSVHVMCTKFAKSNIENTPGLHMCTVSQKKGKN